LAEILLDSDVIIAWLRGYRPYNDLVPELLDQGNTLVWSSVSIAEIFAGARKSEERQIESLFLIFEAFPISLEIGKKAGKYLNLYGKSHGMELGDALIAASASIRGIPLWTLNRRHYPIGEVTFFSA
jgi:predicted nucleic acid-binding protein